MIARLVVMLVLLGSGADAQEAVAPKLTGETPAPTVQDGGAAQAVPSTLTICIDRTAQRCWSAVTTTECAKRSQGGAEVFATVPADSLAAGQRLRACWDEVKR